jgi:hypothetical protein
MRRAYVSYPQRTYGLHALRLFVGLEGCPPPQLTRSARATHALQVVQLPVAHAGPYATGKLGGKIIQSSNFGTYPWSTRPMRYG